MSVRRNSGDRSTVCVVNGRNGGGELRKVLPRLDCEVREFATAEAFLADDRPGMVECLVLELDGSASDGIELLARLKERHAGLPVIVLAERGSVPLAVRVMRAGAAAYLERPCLSSLLLKEIRRFVD